MHPAPRLLTRRRNGSVQIHLRHFPSHFRAQAQSYGTHALAPGFSSRAAQADGGDKGKHADDNPKQLPHVSTSTETPTANYGVAGRQFRGYLFRRCGLSAALPP
jgi:hypothetical protein